MGKWPPPLNRKKRMGESSNLAVWSHCCSQNQPKCGTRRKSAIIWIPSTPQPEFPVKRSLLMAGHRCCLEVPLTILWIYPPELEPNTWRGSTKARVDVAFELRSKGEYGRPFMPTQPPRFLKGEVRSPGRSSLSRGHPKQKGCHSWPHSFLHHSYWRHVTSVT